MNIKKPVSLIQHQNIESGSTALAMVLGYYNKWLDIDEINKRCRLSKSGIKVKDLVDAAVYFGMKARSEKLLTSDLKQLPTPFIVTWKRSKYAVVYKIKKGRFYLNDTYEGSISITEDQFDYYYNGTAVILMPGADFKAEGKKPGLLGGVVKRLSINNKHGFSLLFIILLYSLGIAAGISFIILTEVFLDFVVSDNRETWLIPIVILMSVSAVVSLLSTVFQKLYTNRISGHMTANSQTGLVERIFRLPVRFFESHSIGYMLDCVNDNEQIDMVLLCELLPLFVDSLVIAAYLLLMFRYNAILTVIFIALEISDVFCVVVEEKKLSDKTRLLNRSTANVTAAALNGIDMVDTLKSMGGEMSFFRGWRRSNSDYQRRQQAVTVSKKTINILTGIHNTMTSAALIFIGAVMIINGHITLGILAAMQIMLQNTRAKFTSLNNGINTIAEKGVSIERINRVANYECDEVIPLIERHPEKLSGNIRVDNVSFSYLPGETPALSEFSVDIKRGQTVALVGKTGSGKSTALKIMSGLYEPDIGTVTYDGMTKNQIPSVIFYSSVGVVEQDVHLFEDSVRDNLKLWDDTIEDYEMILGAADAQIYDTVMRRKEGFETLLENNAANFSGGERQRLELAGVLAKEPTILFLDEATAALDAVTEEKVIQAIKKRKITCVMAAHRLSTIRDCDTIIVFEKGRIAECGTHKELMEKDGLYLSLVKNQ